MVMREDGLGNVDEDEVIEVPLAVEFYMKLRETPIHAFPTYRVHKRHLPIREEAVSNLMDIATHSLLATIDTVGEHRFVLSDERFNKQIILTDEIQAISVLAPDEGTILDQL